MRSSETRTEAIARELLTIRGWQDARPPKGNVLWKNEYRDYPHLLDALAGRGKKGKGGDGYPDFIVLGSDGYTPLIVGEAKASDSDIEVASYEASDLYGEAFLSKGWKVLAAGIAGDESSNIAVRVQKRSLRKWKPISYRSEPIQWLPTPAETKHLLADEQLFDLQPRVPSNEVLAKRGDEINRALRECGIADAQRPAITGAIMLALWHSKGEIRNSPAHILKDINTECKQAFITAGKTDLADSIRIPEANDKLAARAPYICHKLRLLNITTLTAEHDYIGQLYESFFRLTGGNTIGQFFTPRHIAQLAADICSVSRSDVVVDPTCGTGGFLIAALHRMMEGKPYTRKQLSDLVRDHLIGFESEPITAALCVANMILRGDGTTGIIRGDCFTHPDYPINQATVVLGNPPFPHRKTDTPPDSFVDRGLEALSTRGELAMVVPGSLLVKGNKKKWRANILKKHTLKAVMTFPADLFQPYASSTTALVVLKKGMPHDSKAETFFCKVDNDGYRLKKNVRVEQPGSQLPKVLEAYRKGLSVPGFCVTTKFIDQDTGEWSPGAYIGVEDHSVEKIRDEAFLLVRNLAAFHTLYAPQLVELKKLLKGTDAPVPEEYHRKGGGGLKDKEFESNTVGSLFKIYYGQSELENKEGLAPGKLPIISSAGTDNGCYGFFDFEGIAPLIRPPFVTVPRTGSIGEAFVQMLPCGVTSDCLLLIPKPGTDLDDLFIAAATIRLERWRFNYGRKITPSRIANFQLSRDESLKEWIGSQRIAAAGLMNDSLRLLADNGRDNLKEKVKSLAEIWRRETRHLSSIERKMTHTAYQSIIALGKPAVPFVLQELKSYGGFWFEALHFMTGEDPTTEGDNVERARAAWLSWGERNGLITSNG